MSSARGAILLMATVALACRPDRGGSATAADISITHAVVPAPPSPSEASAFLSIDNLGLAADASAADLPAHQARAATALQELDADQAVGFAVAIAVPGFACF